MTGPAYGLLIGSESRERERAAPRREGARQRPTFRRKCARAAATVRSGAVDAERLHDLIGEIPLSGRKTGRILRAHSRADVVMHPRPRASDLVGAPIQLPYLLEQCLEHVVIDRQGGSTLLAAEESLDAPVVEVDTAGGRFCGRNLQRTGPPAALRTHSHIRGEHVYSRVRARKLEQCADGHVDRVPVHNVKSYHAANSKDGSQAARAPTLRGRHFGTLLHWSPFPECLRLVVRYSPLANKRFGHFGRAFSPRSRRRDCLESQRPLSAGLVNGVPVPSSPGARFGWPVRLFLWDTAAFRAAATGADIMCQAALGLSPLPLGSEALLSSGPGLFVSDQPEAASRLATAEGEGFEPSKSALAASVCSSSGAVTAG